MTPLEKLRSLTPDDLNRNLVDVFGSGKLRFTREGLRLDGELLPASEIRSVADTLLGSRIKIEDLT